MPIATRDAPVEASVLVGSVNGGDWIHVLLDALEHQDGGVRFEVIVADRCQDGTAERIRREHPAVQVLDAAPMTELPTLRTMALEQARGKYVFVTEDHNVPPSNWISRFVEELESAPESVAAVGGLVDNAMRARAVDWAAFLCEYAGFLPPEPSGDVPDAPGMNVAYRRSVFDGFEREVLTRGFWESTVHPRLREQGRTFRRAGDVVMSHRKRFGFRYFLSQRYVYSRYYAGVRFEQGKLGKRLLYAALSPLLPPLVLMRVAKGALAREEFREPAKRSLPALACFSVAWGVGEAVGYLFGPGDSLSRIE
jgi:glycosyltransferase involved in cell wall biosynthesis